MTINVLPPDSDSKIWEHDGKLMMYIGRVTVNGDTVTVVPCRGITEREVRKLETAPRACPTTQSTGAKGRTA